MTAVQLWWKERLVDRHPIGCEALRMEGYNLKTARTETTDPWPRAVARQALFEDYKIWFEDSYLPPYKTAGYYADFPDNLPRPTDELGFFTTIAPFLYIVGKKQQVRAYYVPQKQLYEDRYVTIKVNRYFVRLCEWEAHIAQFELLTGMDAHSILPSFDPDNAKTVARAISSAIRRIKANRQKLPPEVGRLA